MPLYRYEALDRTGKTVVGAMQVADERALCERLAGMGYRPTRVEATGPPAQRPPAPGSVPQDRTIGYAQAAPVSDLSANERSLARLHHQLYISFRAGMPAYQALTTVQGQVREQSLRHVLGEMALGVQQGNRLSDLMERHPRIFSRGDVGMFRAAEMGGFLPEAFQSIAQRYEQDDNTRRRLAAFAWLFHLNFVGFLIFVAVAQFFPGATAHAAEPDAGVSGGFRAVANALVMISLPGFVLYVLALMGFNRLRRSPGFARTWHRFLLRVPVAGKINYLRANAILTMTLAQLYKAAVLPARAWEAAAGAVPNLYLSEQFMSAHPAVESTQKLSIGLQQCGLMEPSDVGMVATGEASGEVDQALGYLAARYEEDTRVALGASVMRGALSVTMLAVAVFLVGEAFFFKSYYGQLFKYAENLVGGGSGE